MQLGDYFFLPVLFLFGVFCVLGENITYAPTTFRRAEVFNRDNRAPFLTLLPAPWALHGFASMRSRVTPSAALNNPLNWLPGYVAGIFSQAKVFFSLIKHNSCNFV